MKNKIPLFLFVVLLFIPSVQATLIDRGGGMIYDSDLNVTWLQDVNYAMTSGYDADGLMTWDTAMTWASNLSLGGYKDWRLPTYDPGNPRPETPTSSNEFGSLWYTLSGGDFLSDDELAPFFNRPGNGDAWYWTGLDTDDMAWRIDLGCACWDAQYKHNEYHGLAVRSGDVASVPEPTSLALMVICLAGLGFARRNRSR